MNPLVELGIRATVLLLVGLCLWKLARNRSAEARVRLLRVVLAGLVILPAVWALGPRWSFDIPGMKKPDPVTISLDSEIQTLLAATPSNRATKPIDTLPFVYGGIALLLLIPAVAGATILRRLWRQGQYLGWKLEDELDEALDTVGVKAAVESRLSDIPSPMVYGVFRRRLLLPRDFGDWPEDHRRLALLHESAHLKRFDCAWQHVAYGVRAVYWCHPLVWFLSRALKDETELAADERAIRSGAEAADYAAALVAIARTLQEPGRLVRSQGVTFMNHRQLDRRVVSVLHGNRRGFSSVASLAMAGFVGLGTLAAAGSQPQQPQPEIQVVPPASAPIAAVPSPSVRIVQEAPGIAIAPSASPSPRAARSQAAQPAKIVSPREARATLAPSIARVAIPAQTKKGTATTKIWAVPEATARTRWIAPQEAPAAVPLKSGKWLTPKEVPAYAPAPNGVWISQPAQPAKAPKGSWVTPQSAPADVAPRASSTFRYEVALPSQAPKRGTVVTQPAPNGAYQIAPLPSTRTRGVPVLRDIPLVGRLFQGDENAAANAKRAYEVSLQLSKMNRDVASKAADDKATADLIEQIRHLHVDSDRDVAAIQKFIERSEQEGKTIDRLSLNRYFEATRLNRANSLRYKTDMTRALTTNLKQRGSLGNLQADRKADLAITRALTEARSLATTPSRLRTLTIDTQSKKPVTLKLMIDGKEQTIEATPDANGVVRISVDEKGNVKVIKN